MVNKKITKKQSPRRYDLGAFVTKNQQSINAGFAGAASLGAMTGNDTIAGATSGLASGAALGTAIMPGIGTAVGAVGGALFGGIMGGKKARAKKNAIRTQDQLRQAGVMDQFESDLDTFNENPYGVYQDGGKVKKGNLAINTGNKKIINKSGVKDYNSGYDPLYPDGNRQFNLMNAGFELMDPTGSSGFSDSLDAIQDSNMPNQLKFLEIAGSLPYLNKLKKLGTLGKGIYVASNTPEVAQIIGGSIPQNDNNARRIVKNSLKRYEEGGDVNPNIINIEKDELQIDPNNGKILRKYTGINPETGGKYEAHSKKGQDTINNMVTAKEGTFIITKKDAKKYEDAVKNNDKLAQNTIMSNIRNKKQQMTKYADGGDIYDYTLFKPNLSQVPFNSIVPTNNGINSRPYTPLTLNKLNINPKASISTPISNTNNTINTGIENALDYLPSIANAFQGLQTPNYLQYRNIRPDVRNRQQVLNNMPNEISVNPVLNSIYGNTNSNSRSIYQNTSNPAIARALNQANNDATNRAINDAYYQNNNMNNSIRGQRAGIYSNLAQSQENINAQNAQMMLNVDNTNRDMDLAKRQQLNYALSQLSQLNQNNRTNRQKSIREQQSLDLLKEIFPNAGYIFDQYKGGRNGK